MSTLKEERSWNFRNKIANLISGERHYYVKGEITFVFPDSTTQPDLEKLQVAILEADDAFPWYDDVPPGITGHSIRCLEEGSITTRWQSKEIFVNFNIHPIVSTMRWPQARAYEKYLNKIAEECEKRKISNVVKVQAIINIRSKTSFKS